MFELQQTMLEKWERDKTFEKSVELHKPREAVFYDGPPFPTGKPHHGTVLVSFIKERQVRFSNLYQ